MFILLTKLLEMHINGGYCSYLLMKSHEIKWETGGDCVEGGEPIIGKVRDGITEKERGRDADKEKERECMTLNAASG